MTNAEKLIVDLDALAELLYRADDVGPEVCQMDYNDEYMEINCKYPDELQGCTKCIKEWLTKEVPE